MQDDESVVNGRGVVPRLTPWRFLRGRQLLCVSVLKLLRVGLTAEVWGIALETASRSQP